MFAACPACTAVALGPLRLSQIAAVKDYAVRGLRALAGFVGKLKVTFGDIEVGIDDEPSWAGDTVTSEHDLQALFSKVGLAAKFSASMPWRSSLTSLQYVEEAQLAALITAMTSDRAAAVARRAGRRLVCHNCAGRWGTPSRMPNACSISP